MPRREAGFIVDGIQKQTKALLETNARIALMWQFSRENEKHLIQVCCRFRQRQVRFRRRIESARKNSQAANRHVRPSQKCEPHILL